MSARRFCLAAATVLGCGMALARADVPVLSVKAAASAAFTPEHPPEIDFAWSGAAEWHGFLRLERFDLLSEQTTVDFVPADNAAGSPGSAKVEPIVPYGVYRLDAALVPGREAPVAAGSSARATFAYAPARDPHQLPEDWPVACHVTVDDPPLPGFKWYRYFSSWAEDNPAKNVFDWSRLDLITARVRDIGGTLLIANDTTPSWTAPEKPVTRPWVKSATAYPPDDMNDLRAYLEAMLRRFDDKAGTIGALEVWNEANTPDRWMGTPEQLTAMAQIFREAASASAARIGRAKPARIVGISVSSGDAEDYVRALVKAGTLPYLDVVSGHWYEEMLSYDRATPISSLPMHVDLLAKPMHDAGFSLPIWNSESGIGAVPREDGRLVPQDELNRRAAAGPKFDAKQPWMLDGVQWRNVSERRSAASFVAGMTMLMGLGVEKTFVYSMRSEGWIQDGAPGLSWVALAEFGEQIYGLDFKTVTPVPASMAGGDPATRVLAYRIGATTGPGVIVAWAYALDTNVGRPKLWQPWLAPSPARIAVSGPEVTVTDLYGREKSVMKPADGAVVIPVGEEPVYVREQR